jgi:signal transduction histidine kinase
MVDRVTARPRDLRLALNVAVGFFLGGVYVVFDLLSEAKIRSGTLTGALEGAHAVIDHTLPLFVGGLLGVSAHYLRVRAELAVAREAANRSEALRERLQKIERDQAVWVLAAAVLHELNNPLHALGLLLDELATTTDASSGADLVTRARAQVDRALSQLEILRSMRSLGEPDFDHVALDHVVRALARDVGSLVLGDGFVIRLECDEPVEAKADAAYVRTILENLLDNSLHSLRARGHGSITIELGVEGGRAVIRVKDDGPALASAMEAVLFDPLRTTKTDGLGLGLPIARALARAMRGDLVLDDIATKAFRLELPLGSSS